MIVAAVEDHYEPRIESIKTPACQESEIITIDSPFGLETREISFKLLDSLNNKSVIEMKRMRIAGNPRVWEGRYGSVSGACHIGGDTAKSPPGRFPMG